MLVKWEASLIKTECFKLDKYTMYRSDRVGRDGGGTILYVRNNVEQRVCRALNTHKCESSAWCWVIEKGGRKILVGSVYRSPNSTRENDKLLLKQIEHANEIVPHQRRQEEERAHGKSNK